MRKLLSRFRYHIAVFFAVLGPGLHHRRGRQRRRRHLHLFAGRRALRLSAAVDAAAHHPGADRHAGDVLAHGRGHRQGPLRPDPRRVRPAHHVPPDGAAGAGQPDQRDGGIRRHGQFARAVPHQPLHLRAAGGARGLAAGGEGQLPERGEDLPVRLRLLRHLRHLRLPGEAGLEGGRASTASGRCCCWSPATSTC